jgi:hypothetical protein
MQSTVPDPSPKNSREVREFVRPSLKGRVT